MVFCCVQRFLPGEAVTVAVAITFGKASQGDAASIKRGAIDGQDRSRGLRVRRLLKGAMSCKSWRGGAREPRKPRNPTGPTETASLALMALAVITLFRVSPFSRFSCFRGFRRFHGFHGFRGFRGFSVVTFLCFRGFGCKIRLAQVTKNT